MSENIEPEPEKKRIRGVQNENNNGEDSDNSDERKVKCPHCSKTFKRRCDLTRHINSLHNSTSTFKCAKCAREFSRKDKLNTHKCKPIESVPRNIDVDEDEDMENEEEDEENVSESAFNRMFLTKTWRIRAARDPLTLMNEKTFDIKRHLIHLLTESPVKFYIVMTITMVKEDQDTNKKQRTTSHFQGGTRTLLRATKINENIDASAEKINQSFDEFLRRGSGWRLETIDYLHIYSGQYVPIPGKSYVPTPKSIAGKKAVINIQNEDVNCFEYSMIASRYYHDIGRIKDHATRPSTYKDYLGKTFDFQGCTIPMKLDDISRFEKNNDLAINVYHIEEKGDLVAPLRITDKLVKMDNYVNLLLIEAEDGRQHYTWIRDFNKLMGNSGGVSYKYCHFCCQGFKSAHKLNKHVENCKMYGGQRVSISKDIVEFKDYHKTVEQPVVIYADFETLNGKLEGCEADPTSSNTNKKTIHQCSGYSYTVVSPYFPQRVYTYRGPDAGEMFLKDILEEEIAIKDWMESKKEEEETNEMTYQQQQEFKEKKNCYVCGERFIKRYNSSISHHLDKIRDLLKDNGLCSEKIPSIKMVKKQKRIMSLELHRDKQVGASDDEIKQKEEKLKHFNVSNEKLKKYLMKNLLFGDDEEDEIFEDGDDFNDEELENIKKKGQKIRDFDVWSGNYKGAAHLGCVKAMRQQRRQKIPVIFHNLAGYDGHIIMQNISKVDCEDPHVIAKSMEKFVGFSIGTLQFTDSLQHLSSSLDKLVNNLVEKTKIQGCKYCPRRGPAKVIAKHETIAHKKEFETLYQHTVTKTELKDLFTNLYSNFQDKWEDLPEEAFELLTRKGVYPYAYMDDASKFEETKLPPKEAFYNDLTKQHITEEDYAFVKKLCKTFRLKNLGELHDLYMETDTLLLADVFENYRQVIMKNYGLDPTHFYTAPSLSWSAGLKFTKVKLEIPQDIDMHLFVDQGLRGGISMVCNSFARANNLLMKEFDSSIQQSFIKFIDANNLYGWAMSQFLPTGNFKWVTRIECNTPQITHGTEGTTLTKEEEYNKSMRDWEQEIMNIDDESNTGYMLEVDVDYPENLHLDLMHDNFPLAPEAMQIEKDMLSSYQEELGDQLNVTYGSKKLCLTLKDKKNYVCHYKNLKFYLKHGLKLKKIHKILQFDQKAWLKPYIDFNTKLRQEADNKFEEGFAKLMNNSFFGKTCEDVRKHRDVKIATEAEKARQLIASPLYKQHSIYAENMVAIQFQKNKVNLNKPRYIGMSILDISKLIMYQFHYEYLMQKYPQAKLLFTDTDSFCYWIPTDTNVYDDICGNSEWFDFSNYPLDHKNYDNDRNNLIPGKMKDEMGGELILEFVGLRAKMYSILNYNGENKRTAKGVIEQVKKKQIKHEDYKKALFNTKTFVHCGSKIQQDKHQLYTVDITKVTLSPFNDKKWITRDGETFQSYSFGNILIPRKHE